MIDNTVNELDLDAPNEQERNRQQPGSSNANRALALVNFNQRKWHS
jgi:hypothetical protein